LVVLLRRPRDVGRRLRKPEDKVVAALLISRKDMSQSEGEVDGGTSSEEAENARIMHAAE
jgi:hypothetical protein